MYVWKIYNNPIHYENAVVEIRSGVFLTRISLICKLFDFSSIYEKKTLATTTQISYNTLVYAPNPILRDLPFGYNERI